MHKKTKGWTPERRKAQAERIAQNKPWRHSTGPRSAEGKAISKMNGLKHGLCSQDIRKLRQLLRMQAKFIKTL